MQYYEPSIGEVQAFVRLHANRDATHSKSLQFARLAINLHERLAAAETALKLAKKALGGVAFMTLSDVAYDEYDRATRAVRHALAPEVPGEG